MTEDHSHGFKIKGAWARAKLEYAYFMSKNWPITAVGAFWDSVHHYDDINAETYSYYRRFTDAYEIGTIPEKSHILEVTPRTGNGTLFFHQKGKVAKAVGADVSDFQIGIYKQNMETAGVPFESVVLTDYSFPFPDEEFDAVLSFETVEHMGRPEKFVGEIGRVLKPGGEVLLTCPNLLWEPVHWLAAIFELHHSEGPHNFLSRRRLHEYFRRAGLEIEVETASVLIPAGPPWLTGLGEKLENLTPMWVLQLLALRRVFRLRKKV